MNTDLTTAEIAALEREIAEKVMGWKRIETHPRLHRYHKDVTSSDAWVRIAENVDPESFRGWCPRHNLADAREVLSRLAQIVRLGIDKSPWVEISTTLGGMWNVQVGPHLETAYGPHEGPAICLLALKVMEAMAASAPLSRPAGPPPA